MTHGFYASPIPGMHRLAHMQVKAACARGLKCEVYNSTVDRSSKAAIISDLCSGAPSTRLLYSTPESLAMPRCASPLMRRTASASGAMISGEESNGDQTSCIHMVLQDIACKIGDKINLIWSHVVCAAKYLSA